MEGKRDALRHRLLCAFCDRNHGRLLRRGQLDARLVHSIGGLVPLGNLMCDEVIFGGVGAGLYGMLMYAIVAVFIAD